MSQDILSFVTVGKFQKDGAVPNMPELGSFGQFYSTGIVATTIPRINRWNETLMFFIVDQRAVKCI